MRAGRRSPTVVTEELAQICVARVAHQKEGWLFVIFF